MSIKLHQVPVSNDGNSQDDFREGSTKSTVVLKTIDDVREVILQDLHVTYRDIKTALGISGSRIHTILHNHLT